MRRFVSIRHNGSLAATRTRRLFLAILLPAAAFLAVLWLQPWAPVEQLLRNGAVSTAESLLWVGTAAVCLFAALVTRGARAHQSRTRFLLAAGLVTLWLGFDDVFLLHWELLGLSGAAAAMAYAAVAALYLWPSRQGILAARPSLLAAAVLLLAASLGTDMLVTAEAPYGRLAEDGLRFLAVAFWAGFHVTAAAALIEELATGRVTMVKLSSHGAVRALPLRSAG
jgi:hypothetical protein